MAWSQAQTEGFALGAIAASDRGAALGALGVERTLHAEAAEVARALADADVRARRAWVSKRLTRLGRPRLEVDVAAVARRRAPARALAMLASSVPKAVGREWLRGAPLPRAGYVPEPALRALLVRLMTHAPPVPRG